MPGWLLGSAVMDRRDMIQRLRERPTGYRRPGKPPELLLETVSDITINPAAYDVAEEYELTLQFKVRYIVSQYRQREFAREQAEQRMWELLTRDIYEKVSRIMHRALHAGSTIDDLRNELHELLRMVEP
jgi:hypothetical protein